MLVLLISRFYIDDVDVVVVVVVLSVVHPWRYLSFYTNYVVDVFVVDISVLKWLRMLILRLYIDVVVVVDVSVTILIPQFLYWWYWRWWYFSYMLMMTTFQLLMMMMLLLMFLRYATSGRHSLSMVSNVPGLAMLTWLGTG